MVMFGAGRVVEGAVSLAAMVAGVLVHLRMKKLGLPSKMSVIPIAAATLVVGLNFSLILSGQL